MTLTATEGQLWEPWLRSYLDFSVCLAISTWVSCFMGIADVVTCQGKHLSSVPKEKIRLWCKNGSCLWTQLYIRQINIKILCTSFFDLRILFVISLSVRLGVVASYVLSYYYNGVYSLNVQFWAHKYWKKRRHSTFSLGEDELKEHKS